MGGVVYAFDSPEAARAGLRRAVDVALVHGGELSLVGVVSGVRGEPAAAGASRALVRRGSIERALAAASAHAARAGLRVTGAVERGDARRAGLAHGAAQLAAHVVVASSVRGVRSVAGRAPSVRRFAVRPARPGAVLERS